MMPAEREDQERIMLAEAIAKALKPYLYEIIKLLRKLDVEG